MSGDSAQRAELLGEGATPDLDRASRAAEPRGRLVSNRHGLPHHATGDLARGGARTTPRRAAAQRPAGASRVSDSRGLLHCAPHRGTGDLGGASATPRRAAVPQRPAGASRVSDSRGLLHCAPHRGTGDLGGANATPRRAAVPQRPAGASRVSDSRGSLHRAPHRGTGDLARGGVSAARRVSDRHCSLHRASRHRAAEPRRPDSECGGLSGRAHLLRAKEPPSSVISSASARPGRTRPRCLIAVAPGSNGVRHHEWRARDGATLLPKKLPLRLERSP